MGKKLPNYLELGTLATFEGVFEIGSKGDTFLAGTRERRAKDHQDRNLFVEISSRAVEAGAANPRLDDYSRMALQQTHLAEQRIATHFDTETLLRLDYQIRWCRSLLYEHDFIGYDAEIWLRKVPDQFFYLTSQPTENLSEYEKVNLLDALLSRGFLFHTVFWYAAKFLSHWRRLEALPDESSPDYDATNVKLATLREAMLLGETWIEAKTVINNADNIIRGRNTVGFASKGGTESAAPKKKRSQEIFDKMVELKANKDGASVSWAAEQACRKGFGTSKNANRQIWKRYQPKYK